MAPAPGRRRRLGDLLIEAGLVSETQLKAALNEQRKWGGRLGRTVVEMGFVTETAIGSVLAQQLELPSIDLDTERVAAEAPTWLRLDLCERYGVFPVGINHGTRTIDLATADPTNVEHLQSLEFATNMKVQPVVATTSAIERAIRKYYFGEATEPTQQEAAAPPGGPGLTETGFELDALMGAPLRPTAEQPAIKTVKPEESPVEKPVEGQLRAELAVLREKVEALEELNGSHVRALRVLLELLIESGLVTREEYLEKLHVPD
jgi:type IV pilus assembly protein PilB